MKAIILTREFPPDVYGGAGVHVEYLARELARLIDLEVRCFGAPRDGARAFTPWPDLAGASPALQTMSVDLAMAADLGGADVVHSHTWYAIFAGHLAKLLHSVPHVVTTHSLEPMRPWKAEQLGAGGYALSSFCERTGIEAADAVVAVSSAMRGDVRQAYPQVAPERIEVVYNGIDTDQYRPDLATDALDRHGVARGVPIVLFVGRVTRQKGIVHLLDAALEISRDAQLVFCAGAPDEPEIERATRERVERLRAQRDGVVWIEEMLPKPEVIQLLSHAAVFCATPAWPARAARRDQGAAGRDPGERGRQHARPGARRDRHVSAAQAPRCRHLGRDGHRHGLCHRRGDRDRQAGARRRGDSAFGFSGMEVETICRYNLPVCVVVFNNDGIYRGDGVNLGGGTDAPRPRSSKAPATTR